VVAGDIGEIAKDRKRKEMIKTKNNNFIH